MTPTGGPAPASEPETRAVDRLMARVGFEFLVNYHAASEDVLYGTSWQVATPTPDDALYETLVGDAAAPAVPGYDQGLTADLYTANGITDEHAHIAYGTLGFTVEMSTCQTAAAADPGDAWDPAGCANILEFPDDEALVEAEFRKNLPFALSIAQSAADPADPVTVTGRQAPEFVVDSFDVSYGDPQTVAVTARRDQHNQRLEYRVNGGRTRRAHVREWKGGERYGDERDRYYAELRGEVTGTRPGDSVEVWFTARRDGRHVESEHFTYTVASDTGADALILASEDYTGVNPTYPAGHGRAEVRRRVRRRPRRQRHQPRHLGRRRPGCPASARRARATSTPWCGRPATTGWCKTPRTPSPTRSCSAPSPTSPSPSASST